MKHYKPSGGKAKKRLLALVLAMALIVGCLLPVYANGVATMDAGFGMDSGFGVDVQLDDDFGVDMQDEDEGADLDLAPGITESVDKDGNIVYEWGESTWNQWDNEQVSPYPDGEQMDPGFAIPTNTYRFWLTNDETKRAAADVEIASAMKLYDMTAYDATEMYGPLYGMYTLVAIADGGTMSDNTVLNPTTANAPDASKPYFAGWYTVDEFGYEQEFLFDHSTVSVAKSATVDVFAKWTAAKSGEAAQPNEELAAEQTYERWFAQLISCSDSAFNDLIDRYLQDAGFEAWLNNLPEDEIQYLSDRMDSFVETIPESYTVGMKVGGILRLSVPSDIYNSSHQWMIMEDGDSYVEFYGETTGQAVKLSGLKAGQAIIQYGYYKGTSWVSEYQYKVNVRTTTGIYSITHTLTDTEVAWVYYKEGMEIDSITFNTVTDGQTITKEAVSGVLLFFVKPKDNYLLTKLEKVKAEGNEKGDLYGINKAADEVLLQYFRNNMKDASNAQALLNNAAERGYLGYYGYTFDAKYDRTRGEEAFELVSQQPQLTVAATADKTSDVKPGETVKFTVELTPETVSIEDTVTGVTVKKLVVNKTEYKEVELIDNEDGTYTAYVDYTATTDDWQTGDIILKVDANISYRHVIDVSDRANNTSSITTHSTIENSGSTKVSLANGYGVVYKVSYDPTSKTHPQELDTKIPQDGNRYFVGENQTPVTVDKVYGKTDPAAEVDDPTNNGKWVFDGWYLDQNLTTKVATDTIPMVEGGLTLYGKWTFVETDTTVTITKNVTGYFGERSKDFEFTVSFADGTNTNNITAIKGEEALESWSSFTLKHGESVVLSGVPIGATITVKETNADDYEVGATVDGGGKTEGNTITHTVLAPDSDSNAQNNIVVTNHKNGLVDAGIDLGSATPYLFLLCVGAVGVATLRRKRER